MMHLGNGDMENEFTYRSALSSASAAVVHRARELRADKLIKGRSSRNTKSRRLWRCDLATVYTNSIIYLAFKYKQMKLVAKRK